MNAGVACATLSRKPRAIRDTQASPQVPEYLASIHLRLAGEDPTILAWELEKAFSEAIAANPAWATPRVRELHDLLRFCKFDAITPWLRDERPALQRALAVAQRIDDATLARILGDALAGKTQGDAKFSVKLPGRESQPLDVDVGAVTRYDGKNWGGTDIALSFAMDDFTAAVVREVAAAGDELALEAPQAERAKAAARRVAHARSQGGSAASLFETLVTASNPRMEVGDWEAFEERRVGGNPVIEITHEANPPVDLNTVIALEKKFGAAARDLLGLYRRHDGAALFRNGSTCGFYLAPIDEWDELLQRAIDWAEDVTWQDDKDEIPKYLYSAIAFGMIPGDSERWLLITEGPHAGGIMLSDTDLIDERVRFKSIGEFVATLIDEAASVLNCGGHVRYMVDGEERFAVRYIND